MADEIKNKGKMRTPYRDCPFCDPEKSTGPEYVYEESLQAYKHTIRCTNQECQAEMSNNSYVVVKSRWNNKWQHRSSKPAARIKGVCAPSWHS